VLKRKTRAVDRSRVEPIFGSRTLNFAHRGFTRAAPENSLAAFRAALELGVDGLELDVRTCKTGEVVVFHDPTLARMTNGRGFVKNKSLAELRELVLKDSQERIPTLEEVFELTEGRVLVNVEIKTNGLPKNHLEQKVVDLVRRYGLEKRVIVSSFNPIVIRRIRKIDDGIVTGYLIDKNFTVRNSEIPLSRFAGAHALHLEQSLARPKLVRKILDLGLGLVVWSVNQPEKMKAFIELGVHAIITDRPEELQKLLREGDES